MEEKRKLSRNRSASVKVSVYDKNKISRLLYQVRMERGLATQNDCAELIGFPASVWSRHEQGNIRLINLNFINKFCEYFGYELKDVLVPIRQIGKEYMDVILDWSTKPEAMPYIERAYQEYLVDVAKKNKK